MLPDPRTEECLCTRPPPPPQKVIVKGREFHRNVCSECGEPFQGLYCPNGHSKGVTGEDDGLTPWAPSTL